MIKPLASISWLAILACISMPGWAQTGACEALEKAGSYALSTEINLGRTQLGQALAFYDASNFTMAERGFQAALFSGLPDYVERSSAHKHLAFVYCSMGELNRCEQAFDAAFQENPSFSLYSYEASSVPWRESYNKVFSRWSKRCGWTESTHPAIRSLTPQREAASPILPGVSAVAEKPGMTAGASTKNSKQIPPGNVRLRVWPWAHIKVDGKVVGLTPPVMRLQLSKGSHAIELVNPGFKTVRYVVKMNSLREDDVVTVQHDFDTR